MCFCGVDVHDGGSLLIARISESSCELVILVRSLCVLLVMCINVKVETEHVCWSVLCVACIMAGQCHVYECEGGDGARALECIAC